MTTTILVFSKHPDSPLAKTRLRKTGLADTFVQDLHRAFVEDTLRSAKNSGFPVEVYWLTDGLPTPTFEGVSHRIQVGDTFSARFDHAVREILKSSGVVIVGTDCPYLDPNLIKTAAELVEQGTAVLGPAPRGGFYLMGVPFGGGDLHWDDCFGEGPEILSVAQRLSRFEVKLMPTLEDIDSAEDLESLKTWIALLDTVKAGDEIPYPRCAAEVLCRRAALRGSTVEP